MVIDNGNDNTNSNGNNKGNGNGIRQNTNRIAATATIYCNTTQ